MPMFLNAVVALIIGGVGRFEAPVLGGLLIGILQAMVVYLTSARWQDAVTFSLLIIFLLLRPQGILGEKIRSV
jgi:branched-chain amino acid transport system permease protein